jgi:hypothetical protein
MYFRKKMCRKKKVKTLCKYCSDYTQKVESMTNREKSQSWFSLYEQYMEVVDDRKDGNIIPFNINYCPMCGRKL